MSMKHVKGVEAMSMKHVMMMAGVFAMAVTMAQGAAWTSPSDRQIQDAASNPGANLPALLLNANEDNAVEVIADVLLSAERNNAAQSVIDSIISTGLGAFTDNDVKKNIAAKVGTRLGAYIRSFPGLVSIAGKVQTALNKIQTIGPSLEKVFTPAYNLAVTPHAGSGAPAQNLTLPVVPRTYLGNR